MNDNTILEIYKNEIKTLIDSIHFANEENGLYDLKEFVEECLSEMFASQKFAELNGTVRKDFFDKYISLTKLLEILRSFVIRYPGDDPVKLEYFNLNK